MLRPTLVALGALAVLAWASAAEANDPISGRNSQGAVTMTLGFDGQAETDLTHWRGRGYYGGYRGYYRPYYGGYYGYYRPYYGGYYGYYRPYYGGYYGYYRPYYGGYYGGGYWGGYYCPISLIEEDLVCYRTPVITTYAAPVEARPVYINPQYQTPQMPKVPSTANLRPQLPGNGVEPTYPYDGGPTNPVPLPSANPQPNTPAGTPGQAQTPARLVSLPATPARLTYPAYGEQPTSFATQKPATKTVRTSN